MRLYVRRANKALIEDDITIWFSNSDTYLSQVLSEIDFDPMQLR